MLLVMYLNQFQASIKQNNYPSVLEELVTFLEADTMQSPNALYAPAAGISKTALVS